ncbi:RsfS/YbeB/iojap family protein [Salicibibacter halophilus]|uniref:RsfS/YbeB/iojap family protein n=1 Tax=Salicibibacter halophilus TaxID=2502791 RepID=UPI003867A094
MVLRQTSAGDRGRYQNEAQKADIPVKRMEGYANGKWVLLDLDDVVIHIFHEDDRHITTLKNYGEKPLSSLSTTCLRSGDG